MRAAWLHEETLSQKIKTSKLEAIGGEEMAQGLRALNALTEDLGSFPVFMW